jgi:hypothetical protein
VDKYAYHWRDSMRLRAGLLWRTDRPTMADYPSVPQTILLLLLVGILWAWAMDRDYADQAAAEIERQEAIAERRANQLGECIEGTARFIIDGQAIVCRKAESFPL